MQTHSTTTLDGWRASVRHSATFLTQCHNTKPVLQMGDGEFLPDFVLIGDSHAQATYAGMDTFCRENNRSGLYLATILSPFWNKIIPEISGRTNYNCNRDKMYAFCDWLAANPDIKYVVVAQRWSTRLQVNTHDWNMRPADTSLDAQTENLRDFIRQMNKLGKTTCFILPYPSFRQNPLKHVRWLSRRRKGPNEYQENITCTELEYRTINHSSLQMLRTLEREGLCILIDPCAGMSANGGYCAVKKGKLLFKDTNHLTVNGSIEYCRAMAAQLVRYLPEARPYTQSNKVEANSQKLPSPAPQSH